MTDPFLGTWDLDPSTLNYESGRPGKRARYVITAAPNGLLFSLDADDADGKPMKVQYGGPLDGSGQALPGDGGLVVVLKRLNERSIESVLKRGETVLDRWTRDLSEDGESMTITQYVSRPNGPGLRNTGVYRRVAR